MTSPVAGTPTGEEDIIRDWLQTVGTRWQQVDVGQEGKP